jgi:phosphate transport system protein
MAGDLRFLAAVFQITLELAGITRHSREIAEISLKLEERRHPEPFSNIVHMAGLVTKMLHQAMEAFAERDIALAQAISIRDDEIDDLDAYINQRLLTVSKANPEVAGHAIYLSQIAHLLERVADRTTNICEWVIYAVTGHMVEMNVEINLDDQNVPRFPARRPDV